MFIWSLKFVFSLSAQDLASLLSPPKVSHWCRVVEQNLSKNLNLKGKNKSFFRKKLDLINLTNKKPLLNMSVGASVASVWNANRKGLTLAAKIYKIQIET